eukprot:Blabericola_migrator_1__9760@NODE_534_length_7780_cov_272_866459_g407_i0_p2_GENE_NODE_534_length_7780_cov_272_866459_g407_i0NODE_534_length_7780_cov_272_866459_g407_i0_p2_ORF_typecomplete_len677_score119_96AMPbinding/PF00501_28/7_6e72AMPbinding_C/PF13193_6/1_8e04AMPbinding_C/PF13193_6/0_13_NODE_534_length_7780_cov_272_866459_g407_i023994429
MGGTQSCADGVCYNRAVAAPDTEGSSPIYRSVLSDELISNLEENPVSTCADYFLRSATKNGDKPFLGQRKPQSDGTFGEYEWFTYAEAVKMARQIGSILTLKSLVTHRAFPEHGGRVIKVIGIFAKNCVEWFLMEQVCNLFGYSLCPLYDTLGMESLRHILQQTKMSTLCVDNIDKLMDLLNEHKFEDLKHLVVLQDRSIDPDKAAALAKKNITVHYLHEWLDQKDVTYLPDTPDAESVHTICYTSGTGGLPKGCLIEQKTAVAVIACGLRFLTVPGGFAEFREGDRFLSFLPLAHVYERSVTNIVIAYGCSIGVYSGDAKRLVEDIQKLRPSLLFTVPRVLNRIHQKVMTSVEEKPYPIRTLFHRGLESKIEHRREKGVLTHPFFDAVVFRKVRDLLNPELRQIVSGGAPLHPIVCDETSCCFSLAVTQGYGLTESFGPCFLNSPHSQDAATVGGAWPCIEFKLVSVPELKMFVSDAQPRGELCLRGPGVVREYLCHANQDMQLWDDKGWYHTGDLVTLNRGHAVQIIGRKRQVFKLSQGEYILPEKIEGVYSQSKYIEQIFVTGNSFKTHPIALIVPSLEDALTWAAKKPDLAALDTLEAFCNIHAFKEVILADMESLAIANALNGFEKPLRCVLIPQPFTPENGQLTPTLKLVRQKILEDYESVLTDMYASLP